MKNLLLVLFCFLAVVSCSSNKTEQDQEQPTASPQAETPVEQPSQPTDQKLFSGPIKSFQIMHIDGIKDLKKRLKKVDVVTLELDQVTKEIGDYLESVGTKLICYTSVGYEKWRDDAHLYPQDAKGGKIKCTPLSGGCPAVGYWIGEEWGNTTKQSLIDFMGKRYDQAKAKNCKGIENDNVDQAFNKPSFSITKAQNVAANIKLAQEVNKRGMFAVMKNGVEMSKELAPYYQGVFIEECNDNEECEDYSPYKGKIVAMKEYGADCFKSNWSVCQEADDYFED